MFFIGIDIGTTSTKALLYDEKGKVHGKASEDYPIYSPTVTMREQDPDEILKAVEKTIQKVSYRAAALGGEIEFISFSSMMHSLIAVDEEGIPLTRCIIWADSRSSKYAEKFKEDGRGIEIYKRTGTPCHPMSPLYKIMWLRDKEPEIFKKTHKFISIKEYVLFNFFDEYLVDYSIASATGLFNIFDLKWDKEAMDLAGIDESKLSKALPTTHIIKGMKEEYQGLLGLKKDIKVVVGASDGCLANLGSNGIDVGTAVVSIGTSGAIRVVSHSPIIDDEARTFCYILTEDKFVSGGPINNGGIVYRWFRDNFCEMEIKKAKEEGRDPYDLINEMIEGVNPGSDGLICLPFLTGERAPYWNANLRGSYLGMSDIHKRAHFARATIEGICYAINHVYEVLKESAGEVSLIYVNGGFTRSKVWVQSLCNILGTNIVVSDNYESPTLGALMLGFLATGRVEDLSELNFMLEDGDRYRVTEDGEVYRELFDIYKEATNSMKDVLESLAHFQNKNL